MIQFRSKSIIADMDGVLFRHPKLFKMVSDRATGFVKKCINPYMSDQKAKKINEVLYKNFGHTVLGLKAIYDPTVTTKAFCEYVYDNDFLQSMPHIEKENPFYEGKIEVQHLVNKLKQKGISFYVFSNAPVKWSKTALNMMDIDLDLQNIIGCDSYIYGEQMLLKPEKESYVKIAEHIYDTEGFPYKTQLIYMDDQMINLMPIIDHPHWKAIWYHPNKDHIYTDKIYGIEELDQLSLLL